MSLLDKLKDVTERIKKYLSDKIIDQVPFNTDDYRFDEVLKVWIPKDIDIQNLDGIRIALSELSHSIDVDNKGINEVGSLVDSGVVEHTFEYEDLLFNTVRIIADCSSNIDLDIVIYYKNVLEDDWTEFYSESLVPADTKLNYRINISEYRDLKVKLTNNSGATLNYNIILFFSKTKFRDIKVVTPTDDLQIALDQGGAIYLASGTHSISSTINLDQSKGLYVYGSGNASVLQVASDITLFNITACTSAQFSNFKIDASNVTTQSKKVIDCAEASDNKITFDNITFIGTNDKGYGINLNSDYITIRDCYFENLYMGIYSIYSGGSNSNIKHNTFKSCQYATYISNSDKPVVIGNILINCYYGIQLSDCSYINISGNSIKNSHYCIRLQETGTAHPTYNIISSNNMIALGTQYSRGVALESANADNTSFNLVSNNNIENAEDGIYLEYVSDNLIIGNMIEGSTDNGIKLISESIRNSMVCNFIINSTTAGISIASGCNNNKVGLNFYYNNGIDLDDNGTGTVNMEAKYTDAEVESVITAELVDGQSIDNAIDTLIASETHTIFSPNTTQNVTIQWEDECADNNSYQDCDLDSFFTVPTGTIGVFLDFHLKDDLVNSQLWVGCTETDNLNHRIVTIVANGYMNYHFYCPLATGNIIKIKGSNVSPVDYNRIWLRVIAWVIEE